MLTAHSVLTRSEELLAQPDHPARRLHSPHQRSDCGSRPAGQLRPLGRVAGMTRGRTAPSAALETVSARHPVVECLLESAARIVANDLYVENALSPPLITVNQAALLVMAQETAAS